MPMLSTLSLTEVSDLRTEAGNFQTHADELKGITDRMFELVAGTSGVWRGEAHDAYVRQFDGLRDDMERLHQQVVEYHDDLIQIANNYQRAEEGGVSIAGALQSDVTLV